MNTQDRFEIDRSRRRYSRNALFAENLVVLLFVSFVLALVMLAAPAAAQAGVSVSVSVEFGPPALPVYVQPPCPDPGFIWVPGYWAWDPDDGYYWVPGMWVPAPFVGALWTPGYWAWSDGAYIWYDGYWGPVVGFYGGVNYGYGYTGYGYAGGYWSNNQFYYNRTVNNINVTNITNVYNKPVGHVRPAGASFNGGPGGTRARPTSGQLAAARQRRVSLTSAQEHQMRVARTDPKQRATVNHGRPAIAATVKPGEFTGHGAVGASRAGAPYKAPRGLKAAPREGMRTPTRNAEMNQPGISHERRERERRGYQPGNPRMERERRVNQPGMPRREYERGINEPRPGPRRQETRKAPPPKERPRGEQEGPR